MEVNHIDKYFSFEVLRRGYDYYKKGKVKEATKIRDGFRAIVSGSEQYVVLIRVINQKYEMTCTCPYAEEANCKHMAAVLYCLKNNNLPIIEESIPIKKVEISDFKSFEKEYNKERYRLFHNRTYIHENEWEDYIYIIKKYIQEGKKYIKRDKELAYDIFEFFLMEIDGVQVYDEYDEKENLFKATIESFKELLKDEKIFVRFLAFVGTIYTIDSDDYYFERKDEILDLLYSYIEYDWQAEDTLVLLNKLEKDRRIQDYQKRPIKIKKVYINYYYLDKEKGLKIAEEHLDMNEICEFLLNIYKNNQEKEIELLEKIIRVNKGYSNEKYYNRLLSIYKKISKKKYLELLDNYFENNKDIRIYHQIKNNYSKEEWLKIRKKYLDIVKDSKLYREICVEEEFYDELLLSLKDKWIDIINEYIKVLAQHRPKELLELYKEKLIKDIDRASCRQHYQVILNNFNNMKQIPHGKAEIKNIIKYIRGTYKNRKALQEEVDFYEETYM